MLHACIIVIHIVLCGGGFVKLMPLRKSGVKGVQQTVNCADYGEEQNGEWEPSVVIDGLALEKTPDPLLFEFKSSQRLYSKEATTVCSACREIS